MITPELKGGHEVTQPVFVEGAEVGDAIAIKINSIRVTSVATASGHDQPMEGRFTGDPFVAGLCPNCGAKTPKTVVKGTGQGAVIGPNQTLTLADVPLNYAGSSGAVLQTAQRIGTAVGLAFITAIVFASASAINWTIGTAIGFVTIGVLMGIGLLIALYDNRTRARQAQ